MILDQNGNKLSEGDFVAVQLQSPLVQGHIQNIIEGGGLFAAAAGQQPQINPTKIVVTCQVILTIHPEMQAVPGLMSLKEAPKGPELVV